MGRPDNYDVFGTYLRATRQRNPAESVVFACAKLGEAPRLSQVFDLLGMSEDEFAKAVGEAEARGFVRRDRKDGQVNLLLTLTGRQLWEQSLPQ